MFIIEKLTVHTTEDIGTFPVTLKLVPCTTTRGQHCSAPPRHRLNQISHIVSWYCSPFLLQHLVELIEVVAGAHVYPADPIGVQWDSNSPIWKAMEAHWCCSAQNIIILQIQRFCMSIVKAREKHWSHSNCSSVLLASLFHILLFLLWNCDIMTQTHYNYRK